MTYISLAADIGAFEFLIIQFFHGNLQVAGRLEFHKAIYALAVNSLILASNVPFAIPVTADLGVNNVEVRTTCKVFQILGFQVSPSPGSQPVRNSPAQKSSSQSTRKEYDMT